MTGRFFTSAVRRTSVKFIPDHDVLIVRRGSEMPEFVVSGVAEVIVGLDKSGRIVSLEIEFGRYFSIPVQDARRILSLSRW